MSDASSPKEPSKTASSSTTSPSKPARAAHLTEFYPYLNGGASSNLKSNSEIGEQQSITASSNHSFRNNGESALERLSSRRKNSMSTMGSYTSFNPSILDLQTLITKTDISDTTKSFEEILNAAEQYRRSLVEMSNAAARFGAALENGAKAKGSGNAADGLLNSSGLFFLVSNHQQILAHSVLESFENPVAKHINNFKLHTSKNDELFKENITAKVKELKRQERENVRLSKAKSRNLLAYRSKLVQLTSYIDEIDKVKHDYYQASFDTVQDTSLKVLTQLGSIVRAQVEISEGIARKGWSGGGLDELIGQCPDPFSPEEEEDILLESQNFTVPSAVVNEQADKDSDDDDTLDAIPALKNHIKVPSLQSNENGLLFQHSTTNPGPVLNQEETIIHSFSHTVNDAESIVQASTPIKQKSIFYAADDSVDDNSFSLPLVGQSSIKDNPQEQQTNKAEIFKSYPDHAEWESGEVEGQEEGEDKKDKDNENQVDKLGDRLREFTPDDK